MENKNSYRYVIDKGIGCSWFIMIPFASLFGLATLINLFSIIPRAISGDLKCIIWLLLAGLVTAIFLLLTNHYTLQDRVDEVVRKVNEKEKEMEFDYNKRNKEIELKIEYIEKEDKRIKSEYEELLQSKYPFNHVASLYKDAVDNILRITEKQLREKHPPAPIAADKVREMKKMVDEYVSSGLIYKYKYELLLSYIPNLQEYAKDDDLFDIVTDYYVQNADNDYDRVHNYLSKEEYVKLSEEERNQLALDRYLNSKKKSKWQIGRDYELYCGHKLRCAGFFVQQYGCINGVEDLGRDIIAQKGNEIYIIQCKYWSKTKVIREKYIMQLFGTKVEYEITHPDLFNKVKAAFVTNIELSETAKKFAKHLDIIVKKVDMGVYPVIKCNINNGNKIYHLPFDQQYDRTEIKLKGEFWADTVKEAVDKGFRRAYRHIYK